VLTRLGVEFSPGELEAELVEVPAVDISATEIRRRVRDGTPIDELVPPAVAKYIESHGLYSTRDEC
jgi:nicotinate-nucleotide adenylyltransferase